MGTITFDTLKYAERLKAAGVSEPQAKAEAEALRDVLAEALDTTLATKGDVLAAKNELKAEITKLKDDFTKLDKEIAVLKWMVGLVMAGVAAQILKVFFI